MLLIAVVAAAAINSAPMVSRPSGMSHPIIMQRAFRPVATQSAAQPLAKPPHTNFHAIQEAGLASEPRVLDCLLGSNGNVGIRNCPALVLIP